MYNGNVQQNPLCIEPYVTKEFSIFPRFSPTTFDPDANSVLLRAHLYTAVDSMHRKPCVQNCSRDREGLYDGNVQQNPLCAASCVTKNLHISPRFSPTTFYRDANSVLLLFIAMQILYNSNNRLFAQNPVFKIVLDKSVKVYLHIHVQRECSAGPSMRRILCDSGISHLSPVLANDL